MKTPISYYGGKQSMLKHILPLIPKHDTYVEPFFGGGAVFWAKEPSKAEVINDYNANVVNFYRELKTNFNELNESIQATPYCRDTYRNAKLIYENPYLFTPVTRAWAFWVCTTQGFSNKIGSWRASQPRDKEAQLNCNKKEQFKEELSLRLKTVQIENIDALYLIKRLDSPSTFFYLDPPYVDSNQGHYGGYTQEHFTALIDTLANIKGKFLLSSYPNDYLQQARSRNGWNTADKDMHLSASRGGAKRKIEALTYNY